MAKTVNVDYEKFEGEENIIAIVTSTKIGMYNGMLFNIISTYLRYILKIYLFCIADIVQISSLPSSKVYFNLDDECVYEMRKRYRRKVYFLMNFKMCTFKPDIFKCTGLSLKDISRKKMLLIIVMHCLRLHHMFQYH